MPDAGKLYVSLLLAVCGPLLGQTAPPAEGPPPVEMPFDRIQPEATFAIGSVMRIEPAGDAVWMLDGQASSVLRIDVKTNETGDPIALGGMPCPGMATAFGAVWVPLCGETSLARIDLETAAVTRTPLPGLDPLAGSVATGVGSVWVLVDGKGTLLRLDPETTSPVADLYMPPGTTAVAFGMDALWAAASTKNQVVRINPHTNVVEKTIPTGKTPRAIAVGENAVWILNEGDGSVTRIDPATNRVVATIVIGAVGTGGAIAAGEGSVWVSAPGAPLVRIDPRVGRVVHRFTGEGGGPLAVSHRSLWIAASGSTVWRVDPRLVAALR
jgi:virginiamycin B lyase